jgi:glycosyl transferase family 1
MQPTLSRRPLRVCLVCHRINLATNKENIFSAFERRFQLTKHFVEDKWPRTTPDLGEVDRYDAIVWFVNFRVLMTMSPFDWGTYAGARIMYETDAFQNYTVIASRRYLGLWPGVVRSNQFHVLVCTGREVRDRLLADGVHAYWIPKAYDGRVIRDEQCRARTGLCYYGREYNARAAMLNYLTRRHVPYSTFVCPYSELNDNLNRYLACLICNMSVRGSRWLPAAVLAHVPKTWIRLAEGTEPMWKNFEAAGAGCAPICDYMPELETLGFRDGETMVSYRTFAELYDKLQHYLHRPRKLREIGRRAAALARNRHTWDDRAQQLEDLILSKSYLPASQYSGGATR